VPYRLFDTHAGRPLDLWEVPLAVMDTALFVHGGPGAAGAIDEAMAGAREAGGACVLLWHNEPRGRAAMRALDQAIETAHGAGALVEGLYRAVEAWASPLA
jgi:hypothetical protein